LQEILVFISVIAAVKIQSQWRRVKAIITQSKENHAASIIQNLFRRKEYSRVYKIMRDFINFHLVGNPRQMLKKLNPREAHYMDLSNKIYLRLRLGGTEFPPSIFYRVYTVESICDINAFAPKNYDLALRYEGSAIMDSCRSNRRKHIPLVVDGTISVGKKEFGAKVSVGKEGTIGWYSRVENNNWREVSRTIQSSVLRHTIYHSGENKTKEYFKIGKKGTTQKKAKKVLRWKRIYGEGIKGEKGDSKNAVPFWEDEESIGGSIPRDQREQNLDHDEENEIDVDELISWTKNLDYDRYLR